MAEAEKIVQVMSGQLEYFGALLLDYQGFALFAQIAAGSGDVKVIECFCMGEYLLDITAGVVFE